jgi:hypothetical protein
MVSSGTNGVEMRALLPWYATRCAGGLRLQGAGEESQKGFERKRAVAEQPRMGDIEVFAAHDDESILQKLAQI